MRIILDAAAWVFRGRKSACRAEWNAFFSTQVWKRNKKVVKNLTQSHHQRGVELPLRWLLPESCGVFHTC